MREITSTFVSKEFGGFLLPSRRPRIHYVCLTEYDAGFLCPVVYPQIVKPTKPLTIDKKSNGV
jgi:2,3-bisphosphoglycerate-independent phosphoglycerate mutase